MSKKGQKKISCGLSNLSFSAHVIIFSISGWTHREVAKVGKDIMELLDCSCFLGPTAFKLKANSDLKFE